VSGIYVATDDNDMMRSALTWPGTSLHNDNIIRVQRYFIESIERDEL
jgi:hypothetical protein